jgi:single-strand DNA-binding protein
MYSNTITICGNVVRDPELRHTAKGIPTTTFGVAVNRKVYTRDDQATEVVSFFNVVAWGVLAENVCESIQKGSRIVVVGRIDQRVWDVEGDQPRRTTYDLVADDIGASFKFATATISRTQRVTPATKLEGSEEIRVVVPDSPAELTGDLASSLGSEEPF